MNLPCEEKEQFWETLCAVDGRDDYSVDEGRNESIEFFKKANALISSSRRRSAKSTSMDRRLGVRTDVLATPSLPRSISAPETGDGHMRQGQDVVVVKETPIPSSSKAQGGTGEIHQPRLLHSETDPGKPTSVTREVIIRSFGAIPRALGKRKRESAIRVVPESRQVFKDLVFYFFPNDDTSGARRFKIHKAIEYGAVWLREWMEGVITHVIVDKDLTYDDLLKYLKMPALPEGVVLVNENYCPDCISYQTLLNPRQRRYEVKGWKAPVVDGVEKAPDVVPTPPEPIRPAPALQLVRQGTMVIKEPRPKGSAVSRVPDTPSRSGESSGEQVAQVNSFEAGSPTEVLPTQMVTSPTSGLYNDALTQVMDEARALGSLHVDLEEEDNYSEANSNNDDDQGSDVDAAATKKRKFGRRPSDVPLWQEKFQCMHKHDGASKSENPNARTIEVLEELGKYYDSIQDQWRTLAYRKAIAALRKLDYKVMTKEDALRVPGIGERLADKIEEIVVTNRLRRLDNARMEPNDKVLEMFLKIYGVGFSTASKWVRQGYRTLEDLRAHVKLTENQKIGIEHYDDFNARIPRAEVEQHGEMVRKALHKIDPGMEVTIIGSYRRGSKDSGDIDLIITKPDPSVSVTYIRTVVVDTLVPQLMRDGFLKVGLATTSKDHGTKWHGASALPGSTVWRRIDLLLVPWNEMGAALIYFTGNDVFNRSMRLLASKKGMRLNQRGLYKEVMRGKGREKLTEGELVEGRDERRIFEVLGVPWRPPHHRIC